MRDIELLHPRLRELCLQLIARARDQGIETIVTETLRSEEEQNTLYAQGRTRPGKIVTNLRYPNSLHCWGLAFDVAVIVGGRAAWDRYDLFRRVGALGKELGLKWGGDFKNLLDMPHFELPGYSVSDLLKTYGSPAVFINSYRAAAASPPPATQEQAQEAPGTEYPSVNVVAEGRTIEGLLINGTSYAPVRPLAETLGYKVAWNGATRTVTLTKA